MKKCLLTALSIIKLSGMQVAQYSIQMETLREEWIEIGNKIQSNNKILNKEVIKTFYYKIKWLMDQGVNPNNVPMLSIVAGNDFFDSIVKLLIKYKEDVNCKSYLFWNYKCPTPLHCAAYKNAKRNLALLIKAEADVNKKNSLGEIPLELLLTQAFESILINNRDCHDYLESAKLLLDAASEKDSLIDITQLFNKYESVIKLVKKLNCAKFNCLMRDAITKPFYKLLLNIKSNYQNYLSILPQKEFFQQIALYYVNDSYEKYKKNLR